MLCNSPKYTLAYTRTTNTQAKQTGLPAGWLAILAEIGLNFCWQPEETNRPITTYKNASYMFSHPVVSRQSTTEGRDSSISINVGVKIGLNYACWFRGLVFLFWGWGGQRDCCLRYFTSGTDNDRFGKGPHFQLFQVPLPYYFIPSTQNQAWQK